MGIGGAGKTAIAHRFLLNLPDVMAGDGDEGVDLPPPEACFVFSFYDAPNPDSFFRELAAWLQGTMGEEEGRTPSFEQTRRLLAAAPRCLLVLDGLEKTQDDGLRGGCLGKITDGRLRALIERLAEGLHPNVSVIVTTRFAMAELEEEKSPNFLRIDVEEISEETAIDLIRERVRGTDDALRRIVRDCGCHALTVDMVGNYIQIFGDGDPNTPLNLGTPEELKAAMEKESDPKRKRVLKQEFRFARVAQRYSDALLERDPAALALLQRFCLFRLGVTADILANVFTGDKKEDIASRELAGLSRAELDAKLTLLVRMGLLESEPRMGESTRYAIHPAVRDGFLRSLDEETAQRGHDAAREGLTTSLGGLPGQGSNPSAQKTLDLLEEIIYHTLAAGHAREAWEIYWKRIGNSGNLGWRLGAFERGERICRAFAEAQASRKTPVPGRLPENEQGPIFNEWALYLKNLGRLEDAARYFSRGLGIALDSEKWNNVCIAYQNLAEVRLTSGLLAVGLSQVEEAVRLAVLSENTAPQADVYVDYGDALALRGDTTPALWAFDRALYWQHKCESEAAPNMLDGYGVLHTLFLVRLGRTEEARDLTELNIVQCDTLHGVGNRFSPQCTLVLADIARETGDISRAFKMLAQAQEWATMRDAKDVLCWASLVRGRIELSVSRGSQMVRSDAVTHETTDGAGFLSTEDSAQTRAREAIEEGLRVACDCGYGIYHIDLLLLRAHVALHEGDSDAALDDIRIALEEGVHPDEATGRPELIAAEDPECGYAWGIALGYHLRAEALLLRAAQALGQGDCAPARFAEPSETFRTDINAAREYLAKCIELRERIQDPKVAETKAVLDQLNEDTLTHYPLANERLREINHMSDGRTHIAAREIFLAAGNASLAAGVAGLSTTALPGVLPAVVVGAFSFQCLQHLWSKQRECNAITPEQLARDVSALKKALNTLGFTEERHFEQIKEVLQEFFQLLPSLDDKVERLQSAFMEQQGQLQTLVHITREQEDLLGVLTLAVQNGQASEKLKASCTIEAAIVPFLDGDALLEKLRHSPEAVFRLVVRYARIPKGIVHGDDAPLATRALDVIDWAEAGGGLPVVYAAYKRATENPK